MSNTIAFNMNESQIEYALDYGHIETVENWDGHGWDFEIETSSIRHEPDGLPERANVHASLTVPPEGPTAQLQFISYDPKAFYENWFNTKSLLFDILRQDLETKILEAA